MCAQIILFGHAANAKALLKQRRKDDQRARIPAIISRMRHKQVAYVLLRITIGVVFLFYGIGKFTMGRAVLVNGLVQQFAKTPLPPGLVRVFGNVIPFAEVILGLCVLFGVFTTIALALMGILLIALTFGMVLVPNPSIVANNLIYCVIVFLLLYLAEYNTFSLERLWKK